ncbi:gliding motility-associated C-terminal domain-containing protein [Microvirga sp. STR05]|uniref:Gliding motility-associated C-terminal domain-containing protein n=1 Tax=Hymenobacter duratus TaxID=2771356 RepID=A0ABR8JLR6_9BACT|nr:gliding motility-associated C-terminal domain-containing protein [Hymenobacter duratus]MBD2716312.1 gliding motility-associated C-terminal domain-containing protein [Hymenobacter duratus]MBR7951227.1 gliding motility-associated C-terminal domain-containing protein [Microvirga sp. STR05]
MRQTLLRAIFLLLLLTGLRPGPAMASHLLGGEMKYEYLDANGPVGTPFRYRITVFIYLNWECPPSGGGSSATQSNVPDGRCNIFLNLYNKTTGQRIISNQGSNSFPCTQISCPTLQNPIQNDQQPAGTFRLPRISNPSITPPQPGGCSIPAGSVPPVRLARYEAIVNLPVSFDGYYAVYTDGTRNFNIDNLQNPSNQNQTLYVEMAPPLLPNSSPTFSDTAVVVICQGDTSILVNNAVDPDGDRLIYSFSTPYNGNQGAAPSFMPPPNPVTYATIGGYSATNPFGTGAGNYAFLNASNGISRYATSRVGRYVVAVEVKEYRTINGTEVLIGSTRREIQLVSRTCSPNNSPQFTPATTSQPRLFTVEEGQSVSFGLAATDPDGNPINLRANSVLLDGSGPFNATFGGSQGTVLPGAPTGSATVQGTGSVSGQFVFNSQCGNGRATPYDVVITASDVACGSKTVADVFQILVTKAVGPNRISGDSIICDRAVARTYSAGGPSATAYQWSVTGGVIQGASTGNTVQVLWNGTGAGRVVLRGISAFGCPTDSVVRTIDVRPAGALAVTPTNAAICPGASTTLTATGGTTYQWTSSTGQTFTGSTITVSPAATTTYSVSTSDGICTTTRQVTVTVNPAAVADAGPTTTATCSGIPTTLGTTSLTGYTYSWSPANGLSNTSAAQPVLVLTNTTSTPQAYTYYVTATTAQGCVARDSVRVTVNPAAVADAGLNRTVCSGIATSIGAASLTGYSYSWSPATGLSSATAANPTLTLTNTTSAQQVFTYILTATNGTNCVNQDTVRIAVNPAAVANAGLNRDVCSGETTTLGAAALAGYSYSWSPATGLSNATAANPTLTLTNTTGAPQTFNYTLTASTDQNCISTGTVRVTVNPAPIVNAGADSVLCDRKTITLGSTALTGYSYQWSPATNLSSATTARPVFTAVNTTQTPLTLTYVVTANTSQNCIGRDTVRITVNPRPLLDSIQGAASVCPTVQGIAYSIRSPRGTSYQWIVTGGTLASGQGTAAITVNWGTATPTASVKAFQVNSLGCSSDTVVFPVRVNQQLVTQRPTGPLTVCLANGPFTYQTQLTNGSTYGWQIIGGTQVSSSQNTVQVNFTQPGRAKLVVTESSNPAGGRCLGQSDTLYVNVLPSPATNLLVAGPNRACVSQGPLTFSLPGATGSTYAWTLNGTPQPPTTNSLPVTATTAGAYTVTVRETNTSGCSGPLYSTTVNVVPPLVITGPANYCPENRTGLSYTIGPSSLLLGYRWTVTGGTIVSGQRTGTIRVDFPAGSTNATISVVDTASANCAATFTVRPDNTNVTLFVASVDAQDDRKINLNLQALNNANNTSQISIRRRIPGSGNPFQPVGNVANTSTSFTDTGVDADANIYEYQLLLTNSCGTQLFSVAHTTIRAQATAVEGGPGRDEGKVTVTWNPYQGFPVQLYRIYRRTAGGAAELVQTVGASGTSVQLSTGSAGFDQCFRVEAVGPGTLRSNSNEACINFTNDLVFYNVVTPNNDGLNDQFIIKNVELYSGSKLSIFNRWGKEVYKTTDYRNTYDGANASAGVYYYLLELPGGKSYKGWFEVVK